MTELLMEIAVNYKTLQGLHVDRKLALIARPEHVMTFSLSLVMLLAKHIYQAAIYLMN